MKKILSFLLLSLLILLTASCDSAEGPGDGSSDSAADTNAPEITTAAPDVTTSEEITSEEIPSEESTTGSGSTITDPIPEKPMDLLHTDLTPYVMLGTYKDVIISAKEIGYLLTLQNSMLAHELCYTKVTEGDRVVKIGDVINVNYKGLLDGVAFSGGEAADQTITVYEDGTYISGFALGFVGTKVGTLSPLGSA